MLILCSPSSTFFSSRYASSLLTSTFCYWYPYYYNFYKGPGEKHFMKQKFTKCNRLANHSLGKVPSIMLTLMETNSKYNWFAYLHKIWKYSSFKQYSTILSRGRQYLKIIKSYNIFLRDFCSWNLSFIVVLIWSCPILH